MKKLICMIVGALLMPAAAWAGAWGTPFGTITYNSAGWTKHEMKMPTAASMAGEAAKQGAISEGGNIQIADEYGWKSGGSIRDSAIGAATRTATSTAAAGAMGAVMEGKMKKMAGEMAMATFKKKGKPYAEIMVTMMKGGSVSAAGGGAYQPAKGGGGGSSGGCKVMEQSRSSWGGKSASLTTSRCPAGSGEHQWVSSANMSRDGGNYFMTAMYTGKASTLAEFNTIVGSDMKSMMSSTSWK